MTGSERPAVSVVVPFRGDRADAERTLAALERLALRPHDELVVADNSDEGVLAALHAAVVGSCTHAVTSPTARVQVVRASGEHSSYHARNVGARAAAAGEWLLFVDSDCAPNADLLDAYFSQPVTDRCAILAGEISGDEAQPGLMPRYARSRNYLSQTQGLHGKAGSAAATANLLVRRAAFEQVGGFREGIRSGGDVDLCWRLLDAGWALEYRPEAGVVHRHRESLLGFLGQVARYAAGARWLHAQHPGSSPRWPLVPGLAGAARDIGAHVARGHFEEATYRVIDAFGLVAHNVGYMISNDARRR